MLSFEVPIVRIRKGNGVAFVQGGGTSECGPLSPAAKALVLGHRIVQTVLSGEQKGFREVACHLGVSHARVSMLVALTNLAPRLQTELLLGDPTALSFRACLRIARVEDWREQERLAEEARCVERLWGKNSRMGNPEGGNGGLPRPKPSQGAEKGGSKEASGRHDCALTDAGEQEAARPESH